MSDEKQRRARLAFAVLDAYPLLDNTASGGIGGAEVRAVTFARALQREAYDIQFVVRPQEGLKTESSGIRITAYQKHRGARRTAERIRQSVSKRITRLPPHDRFYSSLDSDVVLVFGVRNDTASIIRSAKESGKRTVLFLTSDRNIADAKRFLPGDRGVYGERGHLCRYALKSADRTVVQTKFQLNELWRLLRVEGALIPNPIELGAVEVSKRVKPPVALWVGRADTFSKRADLCVELAKRCPNIQFKMVMNNHDETTFAAIRDSAPTNVDIIERVSFDKIDDCFRASTILVNTSSAEGFPNTFLQAGKHGKPIVSLAVDPGGMLQDAGCGAHAFGSLELMSQLVEQFCKNARLYARVSDNISSYVRTHHDATDRCRELHELLGQLLDDRNRVAA